MTDTGGEAIYLRDEDSGQVWSPTSLPASGDPRDDEAAPPYRTRHGFGYSVFEHDEAAVHSELTVFVALDAAVKFSRLVLRNDSGRAAAASPPPATSNGCSATCAAKNAPHVLTEIASDNGALYARNRYSNDFGDWIAFFDVDPRRPRRRLRMTGDRDRIHRPQRVAAAPGRAAARAACRAASAPALDPCGAIQVRDRARARAVARNRLPPRHGPQRGRGRRAGAAPPRQRRRAGDARRGACALASRTRRRAGEDARSDAGPAGQRLADVPDHRLPHVGAQRLLPVRRRLRFPRPAAGRDGARPYPPAPAARAPAAQRQPAVPRRRRAALVASAAGRGVRTHISDDYLWLPLALAPLRAGDQRHRRARRGSARSSTGRRWHRTTSRTTTCRDARPRPQASTSTRCASVQHGLRYRRARPAADGRRRLERRHEPRRRSQGRGESVWLGFFLCEVLREFAPLARRQGDEAFAQRCDDERAGLARRLEQARLGRRLVSPRLLRRRHAARVDATTPSAGSMRSRRAGRCYRASAATSACDRAMDAVATHLVRDDAGLVQLLDPPFDRRGPEPGLHRRLRARRARERRAVHPQRGVGGDGLRRAWRRSARLAGRWT